MTCRAVLSWLVVGLLFLAAGDTSAATRIGDKAPNSSSLRDLRGNKRALHGFKGNQAVVLVFLGTECPISNLYLPRVLDLEKQYRSKQVQFLGVYPNESEDLDAVSSHAYDRDLPFPILKDFGQKLADDLGVTRVPSVVVLDGDFTVRYRGRVDDRYGVAYRRDKATRDDLAQALEHVLGKKPVSVAETEADGCLIDRGRKATKMDVTYTKDIAGILQNRCQDCHRPEQGAPFTLLTYDEAARHGRMMKEVTAQRRMPPWHADPRYGKFTNDRRMTKDEIEKVAAWVDAGMPRGDGPEPKPREFPKGWLLGKPDMVFTMPEEFEVPAEGVVPYKHYEIDPGFTEDKWVKMAEARPGSPSVLHHVVVYIIRPGQRQPLAADGTLSTLVGWAPGDLGLICPPDTALRIPKGSKLRFELHYTPNGTKTKDRSICGITFAEKPPKFELFMNEFANMGIQLPPHDPHYRADATLKFPHDARLLALVPHMHWRGKDYRYEVRYPDGKTETVLSVPRWDFNWQSMYRFAEPLKLPAGTRLYSVAHWDNSRNNPYNPDPSKTVRFGLQTWEEMMVGWAVYVWERPETVAERMKNPPSQADLLFDRLDRNGDDVITPDEIPDQMKPFILVQGVKVPEKLTRAEFAKMFEEMRKRFPQKPRPNEEKKPEAKKP